MIKKLVSAVAACITLAPAAAGWGLFPGISDKSSFLYTYLGKKEVVQPVCVQTDMNAQYSAGLPQNSSVKEETLIAKMEEGLNYWFVQARQFLQASGRADEFADVLAVLPEKITLQPVPDCNADGILRLVYAPRQRYVQERYVTSWGQVGYITRPIPGVSDEIAYTQTNTWGGTITLYRPLGSVNLSQVLAHEAGHLLGLTDQQGFMSHLIPGENTHNYFSYLNVQGKNTRALNRQLLVKKPASLMGNPRYHTAALKQMWPDDIDGLINAVDYICVYEKQLLSPRVVNGWKSFSLADKNVGYALGVPFQYEQDQQPVQLLERVQTYTHKIAGLDPVDFAGVQRMYRQQETPNPLYAQVSARDVEQWQVAELARRELLARRPFMQGTAFPWASFQTNRQEEVMQEPAPVQVEPSAAHATAQEPMPLAAQAPVQKPLVPLPPIVIQLTEEADTQTTAQTVADDTDCKFYMVVTDKDLYNFYTTYSVPLNSARRKMHHGKRLTKQEKRILAMHTQLRENYLKTAQCRSELAAQ